MSEHTFHIVSIVFSIVAALVGTLATIIGALVGLLFHGICDELTSTTKKTEDALLKIERIRGFLSAKHGPTFPEESNGGV